jgi:hypothetical protein
MQRPARFVLSLTLAATLGVAAGGVLAAPADAAPKADPSREMREKLEELKKKGCRLSPTAHVGNTSGTALACIASAAEGRLIAAGTIGISSSAGPVWDAARNSAAPTAT